MNSDPLPYDIWITDALRTVVRRSLELAVNEGLPGDHHFFVTFRTDAPGVNIPRHLKAQYPEEITIVLQHQYWDLTVDDEAFAVTLRFSGRDARLMVPFAAVTAFSDPSVKFGLQFKSLEDIADSAPEDLPEAMPFATEEPSASAEPEPAPADAEKPKKGEVIALERFRKKS